MVSGSSAARCMPAPWCSTGCAAAGRADAARRCLPETAAPASRRADQPVWTDPGSAVRHAVSPGGSAPFRIVDVDFRPAVPSHGPERPKTIRPGEIWAGGRNGIGLPTAPPPRRWRSFACSPSCGISFSIPAGSGPLATPSSSPPSPRHDHAPRPTLCSARSAGRRTRHRQIHAHYVTDTVITFETEVPSEAAMAEARQDGRSRPSGITAERAGRVVGYAYVSFYRPRAYRFTCEI